MDVECHVSKLVCLFIILFQSNSIITDISTDSNRPLITTKLGQCPNVDELNDVFCQSGNANICESDIDCNGIQKCCLDGCSKKCIYATITTGMI